VDLQPINSMKKIRKLEIDYMTEEMLAQLGLGLKELREFQMKEIISTNDEESDDEVWLDGWKTFIDNHNTLEVLQVLDARLSVQQLQFMLETMPVLKSLEFGVYGCDMALVPKYPEYSAEEYKKDQAEKTAKLIGENYDRFKHLKLDFDDGDIYAWVLNYLESHYRGVNLNK
jgi:hypothetical protein